eukprot:6188513-Pleurochrysis_carterae.AAC.4
MHKWKYVADFPTNLWRGHPGGRRIASRGNQPWGKCARKVWRRGHHRAAFVHSHTSKHFTPRLLVSAKASTEHARLRK